MSICEDCNETFDGYGKMCPRCRMADRAYDMAVGDKGR